MLGIKKQINNKTQESKQEDSKVLKITIILTLVYMEEIPQWIIFLHHHSLHQILQIGQAMVLNSSTGVDKLDNHNQILAVERVLANLLLQKLSIMEWVIRNNLIVSCLTLVGKKMKGIIYRFLIQTLESQKIRMNLMILAKTRRTLLYQQIILIRRFQCKKLQINPSLIQELPIIS